MDRITRIRGASIVSLALLFTPSIIFASNACYIDGKTVFQKEPCPASEPGENRSQHSQFARQNKAEREALLRYEETAYARQRMRQNAIAESKARASRQQNARDASDAYRQRQMHEDIQAIKRELLW